MSTTRVKPLQKGKCLEDLKKLYDIGIPKKSASMLCSSAAKLLQAAIKEQRIGNEEDSYIYFMKYLNVISFVQKSDEFKKKKEELSKLMPKKSVDFALESAEKLNKALQKRYEQQSREEQKDKEKAESEILSMIKESDVQSKIDVDEQPPLKQETNGFQHSISSMELFKILQKDPSNVLIMDARPRNQYSDSHISFDCSISIPEEILEPGSSASMLAQKLPSESRARWPMRLKVDYLVLMDWFSSSSTLQANSPLNCLRLSILEWDPHSEYHSKPLILDGGFGDWLNHYPMCCTNAKPQLPVDELDELLQIDDVIYPTLIDETPKFSRATKPSSKESPVTSTGSIEVPRIPPLGPENGLSVNSQPDIPAIPSKESQELHPSVGLKQNLPQANSNIPIVDRNSKVAALQRYEELEEQRAKGMQLSRNLVRDREAAEYDLKQLKNRDFLNQLSDMERQSLQDNEVKLKIRIQELQKSQRLKDEENETLRKLLEEYRRGEQGDFSQHTQNSNSSREKEAIRDGEVQSPGSLILDSSGVKGDMDIDALIPSASSGMKRSRSSPNIAQLIQSLDIEKKPLQPTFDRTKKPVTPKPQNFEVMNRPRNFQKVYGTGKPGLTGLKNLGNSCYMNSILQCISNLPYLTDYFCNGTYKEHVNRSKMNPTQGEVVEEVAQVVRNLWLGEYRSIACRDLKMVVGKYMDQFRGCGQQDAHEFLTFLMDWLHNDLKLVKDKDYLSEASKSTVQKKKPEIDAHIGAMNAWNDFKKSNESFMLTHFFVQQVSTVTCSSCYEKSMNFEEPTSNLTLLLPSATRCLLKDCLQLYTIKEKISGYKCDACHGLHDAEKTVDLCRLPPLLIIHLKRFYSDGFYHKRQTVVDFPLEGLDMRPYTLDTRQRYTVYNLCGVSNHYGTLEGGHYTAYCKNGTRWYKFDDQDVSEIQSSEVRSANAYILFYAAAKQMSHHQA